jgi:leucyl/phenylalanyl-tRNA--protein transferase
VAWALMPARIAGVPGFLRLAVQEALSPTLALPDPERALRSPPGLAGIVHDFSPTTILEAYRRGLYPLAHVGPLKWWSPPDRCVLFFDELHIEKNLRRDMRKCAYTVTFDRDFEAVIVGCAGHRRGRWKHLTWITPRIMRAYAELFDAGYAHSFEVWNKRGDLVGGGYGVAIGGCFVTESQFSRERNTSKIGFSVLNWHLAHWDFAFNDVKFSTPTFRNMGFRVIPRPQFLARLAEAELRPLRLGRWHIEVDPATVAAWQPDEDLASRSRTISADAGNVRSSSGR